MTNTSASNLSAAADTLLARERADGADPAAAVRVYEKAYDQLAPILGPTGVSAIFSRAVVLAKRNAPLLETFTVDASPRDAARPLLVCLERAPAEAARAAIVDLHAAFFRLVITFLGDELTAQILRGAWPDIDVLFKETK